MDYLGEEDLLLSLFCLLDRKMISVGKSCLLVEGSLC